MKLIPPQIIDCNSAAERKIFEYLREISFGPYDVALHSLNIGLHDYKRWGEADFVIVSKRGILLLEVKGGRVACRDGIWEFTNRRNETNQKKEGPAEQSKSAYFSLENNYLNPKFRRELFGIPKGWGVVFTDIPRLTNDGTSLLPEHPDEITAYEVDCLGHNSFKAFLEKAFDHWKASQKSPRHLPPQLVNKIVASLRPNFEKVPSLNSQLHNVEQRLYRFTGEQYEKLDAIEENDRILITGGAGTGKTFVAAACARYEAAEGRRVLFVTRSPFLSSFLSNQGLPDQVTITTIEEVEDLQGSGSTWDTLIVDEGQDLCAWKCLELLDSVLERGWEAGRWRWFGDPNFQVSPSYPVDELSLEYLKSIGVSQKLKNNIRNAGKVIDAIKELAGADVGKPSGPSDSGRVHIEAVKSQEDILPTAASAIKSWLRGEDPAPRSAIAVLVPDWKNVSSVADFLTSSGVRTEPLSQRALAGKQRDCVLVAAIEEFKGLERPLVCVAGLGAIPAAFASNAYKAISRANHELVLIATEETIGTLTREAAERAYSI